MEIERVGAAIERAASLAGVFAAEGPRVLHLDEDVYVVEV